MAGEDEFVTREELDREFQLLAIGTGVDITDRASMERTRKTLDYGYQQVVAKEEAEKKKPKSLLDWAKLLGSILVGVVGGFTLVWPMFRAIISMLWGIK